MDHTKKSKPTFMPKRADNDLLGAPLESAEHAYRLFKDMENEAKEKLVCLHLTDKYEIISFEVVALGAEEYVLVEPQEIVRSAALIRAKRIVLIHNHPLGSANPFPSDIETAIELKKVAEAMKIVLQDMLIVGNGEYMSLSYRGYI